MVEMMQIETRLITPKQLLLDPNNYRFHDLNGYRRVSRSRYPETGVQERALQFLRDTAAFDLNALRDSIISNGFVPFEQIVVETFDVVEDMPRYLVVEGNRRTAALKTLLSDYQGGGLDLNDETLASLESFNVLEIIGTDTERLDYQRTLMAIRHVAGIREWGPYQQARLVVEMHDKEDGSFGAVAQRIGISAREVGRRYRASKALEQMEKDDEFGEYAEPRLYSFFHEAVSQPKVREWLGYSDQSYKAENAEARRIFYELLSPSEVNGVKAQPKLQSSNQQVRQLKDIVSKPVPLKILADPERSFADAVKAAEAETPQDETGILEHSLGVALHALRQPSIDAWLSPDDNTNKIWADLIAVVDKVREFMNQQ